MEAIVSGRVQMVMYRDFACRKARGLGLTGEVENVKDGTVRVVAEGSRDALQKFIKRLERGSLLASVKDVSVVWKPASGAYTSFDIVYR